MRLALVLLLAACQNRSEADPRRDPRCVQVDYGYGRTSEIPLAAEVVASGLEVPSGLAFLPDGSMLVSDRTGRLVRIAGGHKHEVAQIGGLHGFASEDRWIYVYAGSRVERWRLAADYHSAHRDRVIVAGLAGGAIAVGPDRNLYIATAGKVLRVENDGSISTYARGVREVEAFAWRTDGTLAIADRDDITLASAGANLGWPTIHGCASRPGMVSPALTWSEAVVPGGAAFYDGGAISEWRGDLVVAMLKAHHLHHIRFDRDGNVVAHDVALADRGRLRSAVIGPDRELYVTTSNCDGRGACPLEGDVILRVTRAR